MTADISIETERLLLRRPHAGDAFSDTHWEQWGCGPYLIERTSDRQLLGGTGRAFLVESATLALG